MKRSIVIVWLAALTRVWGQLANVATPDLQRMDVEEHLGQTIPLDVQVTNDAGQEVALTDYFNRGKPVIIVMAYYRCPMLCTLVLNGLTDALRRLSLSAPQDFTILTVSIDPGETFELAAVKKKNYLQQLAKPGYEQGWWFFAARESESKRLADALGFRYFWDERNKQYAHPAAIFILTSTGRISRYLYGIEFKPTDVRMGLLEASAGAIGATLDRILLYCYHYDPQSKGYVIVAGKVMQVGGGLTILLLALFLASMWTKEKIRKR